MTQGSSQAHLASSGGLRDRLPLDEAADEDRQLVAEHRELFRLSIPEARLRKLRGEIS
jgi:hypothetical protein